MRLIAFCGPSGSGKDSLTNYLLRFAPELMNWRPASYGQFFVRYAFADRAKDICSELLAIDRINFEGERKDQPSRYSSRDLIKFFPFGGCISDRVLNHREVLCLFAEFCRELNPFCWINPVFQKLTADNPNLAIISDARRIDEFRTIKVRGGKLIKLNGWGADRHPTYAGNDFEEYQNFDAQLNTKRLGLEKSKEVVTQLLIDWGYVVQKPEFMRGGLLAA